MSEETPARADFGIVTILPDAYESMVRMCELEQHAIREGYQWAWGSVPSNQGGDVTIAVGSPVDRESLATGFHVDAMLRAWEPRSLLLVDIGGAVKGREEIALGDVVIHTDLFYYDFHKVGEDGSEEPRHTPLAPASTYLRELARRPLRRKETRWLDWIATEHQEGGSPKVHEGEMLSGGALFAKSPRLERLLADRPKALVVEMEGASGARAVLDSGLRQPQAEFLVIRGVSDYCNDGQGVNQETRERWRRYAAEAASAMASAIVKEARGTERSDVLESDLPSRDSRPADAARKGDPTVPGSLWQKLPGEPDGNGKPFFELNFEIAGEACSVGDLGDTAREVRRLALLGPSGAGKTFATLRTLQTCQQKMPVIFVKAEGWARGLAEDLLGLAQGGPPLDWRAGLDAILRHATVDVTIEKLKEATEKGPVILAVDSVNSARAPAANLVLEVLDQSARHWTQLAVIVTDRSAARYSVPGNWTVASTVELKAKVAERPIDERYGEGTWSGMSERAQRLLVSPFFLDLALQEGGPESHSRSEALQRFVAEQAGLDDEAVNELAEATAAAYGEGRRNLPRDALCERTCETLSEAGLILPQTPGDGRLAFTHELYGDYFASLHLVKQTGKWPVDELNAISFSGERWKFEGLSADTDNFDAITLAAEQMPPEAGDAFLRAVYDWNWRAAVDCLNWTEPDGGPFSEAARLVVLSLLSERCVDPVDGTSKRALRLLSGLPDPIAQMLAGASESEARQIIAGCSFEAEWFEGWRDVFCRDRDRPWSEAEVGGICKADTLHGWTVSYVLKRASLSPEACRQLIGIYQGCRVDAGGSPTLPASIRWRVVHSLAAGDGEYLLPFLLDALDGDPYPWVRWGAARSLTEFAARAEDPERSALAIDALTDRVDILPISVANEIAWASLYRGAVPHFPKLMKPLLRDLQKNVRGEVDTAQWAKRMADFDRFWDES